MSMLAFGWDPVIWLIAFVAVMVIAYLFRSRGEKKYKKGTDQAKIFLCGEEVPEAEWRHIRAHNIYWGFFETLEGYYVSIMKPHTGIINDYVTWLIGVIAISAVVLFIVGLV